MIFISRTISITDNRYVNIRIVNLVITLQDSWPDWKFVLIIVWVFIQLNVIIVMDDE